MPERTLAERLIKGALGADLVATEKLRGTYPFYDANSDPHSNMERELLRRQRMQARPVKPPMGQGPEGTLSFSDKLYNKMKGYNVLNFTDDMIDKIETFVAELAHKGAK